MTTTSANVHEQPIALQDGQITTRVLSAGSGQPLLFLHDASGLRWDPFLDDLASRFTVYAPEHIGSGDSQGLDQVDNLWDLVLVYNDLLDTLNLPSAAVVGHGFGGLVAAELAANNPNRVEKLVLIAPMGLWRDDAPIADLAGTPPDKLAALALRDPLGPLQTLVVPPMLDPEARYRHNLNVASVLHFTWPIPDKGLKKRLHRVQAPTLLIWGQQDGLVPPVYAEEFAARLRDAQIALIERAAHFPHLEQKDQVAKLVAEFLG